MPLQPGEYGELEGTWWVRPPRGGVSPLSGVQVEEHEDQTITVYGLIQFPKWTGFLKRGEWSEQPHSPSGSWRGERGADGC